MSEVEINKPRNIDGITCFQPDIAEDHADYHAAGLDNLYAAEKDYFWFVARRERILAAFQKFVKKPAYVLEIGAGTGYVAQGILSNGYRVAAGEMHLSGLRYARRNGIEECYQFDLFKPPFENKFDAIGMFDVLEHLEDDVLALRQVSKMLKPDGLILVTVPAHQWLWNRDDAIAAHKVRYGKRKLNQVFEQAGLQVLEARFFFIAILPLLYLRRLLNRDSGEEVTDNERIIDIRINPLLNKLLLGLSRLENTLSNWIPNLAGGSLLLVAIKISK